jgi:GTP pyrophosphokinase
MLDDLYKAYEPAARSASRVVRSVIEVYVDVADEYGLKEMPFSQRPTKTQASIVAKLHRDRTRLSSMQDIIGCRIVVGNRADQRHLLGSLSIPKGFTEEAEAIYAPHSVPASILARPFRVTLVYDRNVLPSHGYRAIHLIVRDFGPPYEIQLRTRLQNRWAQLSELSDDLFPGIKYGGGPSHLREGLLQLSDLTDDVEREENEVVEELEQKYPDMDHGFVQRQKTRVREALADLDRTYDAFEETLKNYGK